jgi:hypothetical protein
MLLGQIALSKAVASDGLGDGERHPTLWPKQKEALSTSGTSNDDTFLPLGIACLASSL